VDVAELRRDIEQRYPGARIEGLEKKPLIRIVGEEKEEKEGKKARIRRAKRKSLIRVLRWIEHESLRPEIWQEDLRLNFN
jgi:hypothetical protein